MKKIMGALLVSAGLILGGCAAPAAQDSAASTTQDTAASTAQDSAASSSQASSQASSQSVTPDVEVDADQVKNGTPEFDGWIDRAVEYVKKNESDKGVLVQVTGLITKGYPEGTTSMYTIVDPMNSSADEEDYDPMMEVEFKDDAAHADVYFASPVETTRWTHLTGVRGMAFLDKSAPNKLVIYGAIEVED